MALATTVMSGYATAPAELQKQADILREEGQSLRAIELYNQAIVQYQEAKDYAQVIGALTGRLLSWKHLYYKTEDKIYAIFVQKEAEAMLAIATEHRLTNKLHLMHFLNGTSAILLQDYPNAEEEFGKAVALYPNEVAEKGDWLAHLGEAVYLNGRKEVGKKMILQGVQKIEDNRSQLDPFLFNVWVSGAFLRLAKLLKSDNVQESQDFLSKAKKIIDSDPKLVIRKQQLDAYMRELNN